MKKTKNEKDTSKFFGIFVKLTKEEHVIVSELKEKYAINLTQIVKNYLFSLHKKLGTDNYQVVEKI